MNKKSLKDEWKDGECEIIDSVQRFHSKKKFILNIFKIITSFGRPYFWLFLAGTFALFSRFHVSFVLIFSGMSYLFTVGPLKRFIKRKRPGEECEKIEVLKSKVKPHSFPSGHTYYAAVSSLSLGFVYDGIIFLMLMIMVALLVGYSRIYIGVHYPTDVLISLILALIISLLILALKPFIFELHMFTVNLYYELI